MTEGRFLLQSQAPCKILISNDLLDEKRFNFDEAGLVALSGNPKVFLVPRALLHQRVIAKIDYLAQPQAAAVDKQGPDLGRRVQDNRNVPTEFIPIRKSYSSGVWATYYSELRA